MTEEGRPILSGEGIWSVGDFASYLGIPAAKVMQRMSNMGVKVMSFSSRYKHKLFRLEDLRTNAGKVIADNE